MYPLLACSLAAWAVIFERLWRYRKLKEHLESFYLEAVNILLRDDQESLKNLCQRNETLPTSRLLVTALQRKNAKDERMRESWRRAVERQRQMTNQGLRSHFWVLGTVASASPFIGLFGTVVGILRSFQEMAEAGTGGFTVVAAGISEALIATAAGIIVAVVALIAYNAFQAKWSSFVLIIRMQSEEFWELLDSSEGA